MHRCKFSLILFTVSLVTGICLAACAPAPRTSTISQTPSKTLIASYEKYGPRFDSDAVAIFPPPYSVSASIWQGSIPAAPIASDIRFINQPGYEFWQPSADIIAAAGCELSPDYGGLLDCHADSPLYALDCQRLYRPYKNMFTGDIGSAHLIAECWNDTQPDKAVNFLHRGGCIDRIDISYIFEIAGEYKLIDTPIQMQQTFAPIDRPQDALNYAVAATGLKPKFTFEGIDIRNTMFFTDLVEATHVLKAEDGYEINLFHSESCGCDSFITSQVTLTITQDGEVSWNSAKPVYIRFDEACYD